MARTAQSYALNANQLFLWRRLYREGRLGRAEITKLLPVSIAEERMVEAVKVAEPAMPLPEGAIEIKLGKGSLHVRGKVDLAALRTVLECLVG